MSTATDVATVGLSTIAIELSMYGVWDKRRETQRQLRIRLSEIIDQLTQINLQAQLDRREPDFSVQL